MIDSGYTIQTSAPSPSDKIYSSYLSMKYDMLSFWLTVATPSKSPPPPPPTSEMLVTVSMETPEIILIEDQMDPASNSLLLSVCIEPDILWRYQLITIMCMTV